MVSVEVMMRCIFPLSVILIFELPPLHHSGENSIVAAQLIMMVLLLKLWLIMLLL